MNAQSENGANTESIAALLALGRKHLESGRFENSVALAEQVLACAPGGPDLVAALYILALNRRYQKRFDEAGRAIDAILEIDPDYGRAYQELGHLNLALKTPGPALAAYEQAVKRNPALLASWKALLALYERSKQAAGAQRARSQLAHLRSLPRELVSVTSMIHEGRLADAEKLCRHFLRDNRHHIEGMRLLAEIAFKMEVFDDAEFLLESCVEFAPDFNRARYEYANVLLKRQKFEPAYKQTSILIEREPDNPAVVSLHASASIGIGENERGIRLLNEVLNKSPEQTALYVMRGHAQKTIGLVDDAVASYQEAYRVEPAHGDAFWSLANTKIYRFTDEEIAHMRAQEAAPDISDNDRTHMCFALGKAFEDRKAFADSFQYYSRGNALKNRMSAHRPGRLAMRCKAQREVCTREFFAQRAEAGFAAPDAIFILGMPRAGSTLLEQILASHSMIDGTLELPNVIALSNRLRGGEQAGGDEEGVPRYPAVLAELDIDYFRRFGEQFIEDTRVYRQQAPFFIDKNPNNFFHIGLIRLILPNAKIIDARRHPLSCCFSCFKQLFGEGQEFTYGLTEVGNYYREYVGLMDHWDEALPGFVLRVQHEDVVDDLETQVRRILDFCGLPFEEACLNFHETRRSVRTPSSEQVRQPIFTTGLEQWRAFEAYLKPLRDALGEELMRRYPV